MIRFLSLPPTAACCCVRLAAAAPAQAADAPPGAAGDSVLTQASAPYLPGDGRALHASLSWGW